MSNLLRIAAALSLVAAFLATQPASAQTPANRWEKIAPGSHGDRTGAMLVATEDPKRMYLVGPGKEPSPKDASFVQAFDPIAKTWTDIAGPPPGSKGIDPYYQTAYDPGTKTIYCLSGGSVLHAFDTVAKSWKALPPAAEIDGLAWHTMACDPVKHRLVVVGADKKADNLGWSRTVVFDIPSATWKRFDVVDGKTFARHEEFVFAKEAMIELVGRIRLAWYRDPKGIGTDEERAALRDRCTRLKRMPALEYVFNRFLNQISDLLDKRETLKALHQARELQSLFEIVDYGRYPVPLSRRNSPLVFDPKNRVFVLFGGDHEDYLMNDTWILDLDGKGWRRAEAKTARVRELVTLSSRLSGCGKIAMYEGYVQSTSGDYSSAPSRPIDPTQLWFYDIAADRWDLAGAWPIAKKGDSAIPAPVSRFYGYASDRFSPPPLATDGSDTLVLATSPATWTIRVDPTAVDSAGTANFGTRADNRLRRSGLIHGHDIVLRATGLFDLRNASPFEASYCEVPEEPKSTGLDDLPENRWVKLPPSPRNPCKGCRQRDWGTAAWDSDRDQILLWGGGHCVRSSSSVVHYSPTSGRTVESYDADEPYGGNGGGGFDSSLLGRPWVSVHSYKHYAYDPKSKLMVAARGYLYDPERMDWLREERMSVPYRFEWGSTVIAGSKHGAVVWAHKQKGDDAGLWLFDRHAGWTDLAPVGKLFVPWCDSHGMVYDPKRDRMIFTSVGGGYSKKSDGSLLAFDFATRALRRITPENADLNKTNCAREQAFVEHADWMLIGELVRTGDPKTGPSLTRIYDCAKNKMFLLDAGPAPDGHEAGWMYDAKRKLVYAFSTGGEAWALRLEPKTAKLVETVER